MHRGRRTRARFATKEETEEAASWHVTVSAFDQLGTRHAVVEARALLEAYTTSRVGDSDVEWPSGGETLDEWRRRVVG